MVCNESSDCSTATDLLNFVRPIIAVSKLSTLRLHFAHLRFAERRHLSTLYPTERLSLTLVFPGYLFFTMQPILYGSYKPQRIRKGGTPMLFH